MAVLVKHQNNRHPLPSPSLNVRIKQWGALIVGSASLALSVLTSPAFAGDPFRPSTPNPTIDDHTEKAFTLIFHDGNYVAAETELNAAERANTEDPLAYAMLASMAYLDQDWSKLSDYGSLTENKAKALMSEDPLRGHLYQAVGIFMRGAAVLKEQGIARGTPQALGMLQQIFSHIDEAEKINPNDPELSLLKGFMDLMLAVNLPFSNPSEAISRLETNAFPVYLAQRGIALGYRDLKDYGEALTAIDTALNTAASNPELLALKAQILALKGDQSSSLDLYEAALTHQSQLHPRLASQIRFEHCLVEGQTDGPTCFANSGLANYEQ
jgi:tetratricopeptide (TPR) repeat protein